MEIYRLDMTQALAMEVPGFATEKINTQRKISEFLFLIMSADERFSSPYDDYPGAIVSESQIKKIFQSKRLVQKVVPRYFYGLQGSNLLERPNIYLPKESLLRAYRRAATEGGSKLITSREAIFTPATRRFSVPQPSPVIQRMLGKLRAANALRVNRGALLGMLDLPLCERCRRTFESLLILSNSPKSEGLIPISYERKWGGRLHDVWGLQNTPRWIRRVMLAGYYDYDIENCHYTLFSQLCRRQGLQTPAVDSYNCDRTKKRLELVKFLGLEGDPLAVKAVKKALISLVFGSRDSQWEGASIPKTFEDYPGAAALFNEHPLVRDIRAEILKNSPPLIHRHVIGRLVSSERTLKGGGSRKHRMSLNTPADYRTALSFLLTSYESHILEVVLSSVETISLCMHDGWISEKPLDIEFLQKRIFGVTGFTVRLEENFIDGVIDLKACANCQKILPKSNCHKNQLVTEKNDIFCSANGAGRKSGGSLVVRGTPVRLCSWSDIPPFITYYRKS